MPGRASLGLSQCIVLVDVVVWLVGVFLSSVAAFQHVRTRTIELVSLPLRLVVSLVDQQDTFVVSHVLPIDGTYYVADRAFGAR